MSPPGAASQGARPSHLRRQGDGLDSLGLLELLYGVERPLRSFAAFEELGGVEFRAPAKFASETKTRRRSGSAAI